MFSAFTLIPSFLHQKWIDVAGYAAAQIRGGVKVVRVPTTPAAMMDAAFAEDAAVDSPAVKDALRVPCPPAAVVIDPKFAATVLDGVWRGGIGEAVRQAAVRDGALMKRIAKGAGEITNILRVRTGNGTEDLQLLRSEIRRQREDLSVLRLRER